VNTPNTPVFFDVSGKRNRWFWRFSILLLVAILASALGFAATVVNLPSSAALEFGRERQQPLPLINRIARLRHRLPKVAPTARRGAPQRMAFYLPTDPNSFASLKKNYDDIDTVVSASGFIDVKTGTLTVNPDPAYVDYRRRALHQPERLLMIQNITNEGFDGAGMAGLLARPGAINALARQIADQAVAGKWQGVVFDIEALPETARAPYLRLLAATRAKLAPLKLSVAATVETEEEPRYLRAVAQVVDNVILMDYDYHWQGGQPGPIAPQEWFAQQYAIARSAIPQGKLIVAIGSYGYDWHDGEADALTINEAWLAAHDSDATPTFDPVSGNSGFAYSDDGHQHTVWMMDAATSWNQLNLLGGVKGIALWRLGEEDQGFWDALQAARTGKRPDLSKIAPASGTDIEGNGEILRIDALPTGGARTIGFAPNGLIDQETFSQLPTPYVVRRTGASDPKAIALTFDDGPDPNYTKPILEVLEREKVPGTFFVIGENAVNEPSLLRREADDGFEIGNHSYTHPNMAEVSPFGSRLELNATQRLIEAYTGRSTRLMRMPYFGDAEPTTADELGPAYIGQTLGYTIVGLHIDPNDWKVPGVQSIVDSTVQQVLAADGEHTANVILLHDGGGDRSQTIAALPQIIDQLRARGYHFVTISQLAGMTHDTVMPVVSGEQLAMVNADVGFFRVIAFVNFVIRWLFFFAIALGIARAVLLTTLALIDRKTHPRPPENPPQPPVSVIIPAYNEEKVIVASVARVLASDYPDLELIIADDGSKDRTSALVAESYGSDPRVRLMTLANGGKASALNRALAEAKGEIIVALDADTQFLPDTISKLVRWFAEPRIGAVAGNARVGNRINLVTRWQSIEYVTAQNVERRALDAIGAITVVPGAVGAWRRAALDDVGGYPEDTLAEDQDLTIAIQRKGWLVAYDVEAIALTEAPESFRALGKQRYRWSFGTMQCLWKHRAVLWTRRPRGLAYFGMPQAWLFQILFAAISPLIDLALLISIFGTAVRLHQHGWAQTQSDVLTMGIYWAVFVSVDLLAGWIAYRLEANVPGQGRPRFPALLMVMQRFVYRQLMYGVVLRSIRSALAGRVVGWGKLERSGSVSGAAG
jgi:cellulose synthase/poly-beta-1,6-N-acetylglucosamine synthase-like glycosyltransferase/peptidoglycan/xylan/chitin deacetylase (PgdA/CDA1 family)/spore germination protein YaaH